MGKTGPTEEVTETDEAGVAAGETAINNLYNLILNARLATIIRKRNDTVLNNIKG